MIRAGQPDELWLAQNGINFRIHPAEFRALEDVSQALISDANLAPEAVGDTLHVIYR